MKSHLFDKVDATLTMGKNMAHTGNIIEKLKRGEEAPNKHFNPYLSEALAYEGTLFTTEDLRHISTSSLLDATRPLVLEIGCYLGKNLMEMAHANPKLNLLGLDITYKRVVKTARRIRKQNLTNAYIGICDGADLLEFLPDASLNGVCIFFPDPWEKEKKRKHRLINEAFLRNLKLKLKPDAWFWFKTDHQNYFEETLALAEKTGFAIQDGRSQPTLIAGGPYQTVFEKLFLDKNLPTYEITFLPNQKSCERI